MDEAMSMGKGSQLVGDCKVGKGKGKGNITVLLLYDTYRTGQDSCFVQ